MTRFFRNKKGQNVAEYAILIALVVGAIIAMQTFVKRGFQGRLKGAVDYMVDQTNTLGTEGQYEPYYQESEYTSTRDSSDEQYSNADTMKTTGDTDTSRTGSQETGYTPGGTVGTGMTID